MSAPSLLRRLHATGLRRPKRVGERVGASRVLPGGRGRVDTVLSTITTPLIVGGIDTDRLYPLHQQERPGHGLCQQRFPAHGRSDS